MPALVFWDMTISIQHTITVNLDTYIQNTIFLAVNLCQCFGNKCPHKLLRSGLVSVLIMAFFYNMEVLFSSILNDNAHWSLFP